MSLSSKMGNIFSRKRKKVEITPAVEETEPPPPEHTVHQTVSKELHKGKQEVADEADSLMEERRAKRKAKAEKQRQPLEQQGSTDLT